MTTAQLFKYRAEWSRAQKAMKAANLWPACAATGKPAKEHDVRMRWHLLIGAVNLCGPEAGQPKSSLILNNGELDRFLKRCAAAHDDAGLARQLMLDEQPLTRLRHATDPLFERAGWDANRAGRDAYLDGIWANAQRNDPRTGGRVFGLDDMPDWGLQKVIIALTHTLQHKLGVPHKHGHLRKAHGFVPTGPAAAGMHAGQAREAGGGGGEAAHLEPAACHLESSRAPGADAGDDFDADNPF
jgi:hypothetical protein